MDATVTVGTYLDMMLAEIVRGRLASEGIDAVVTDDLAALANDGGIYASRGVRVRVAQDQAEAARRILAEIDAVNKEGDVLE
ncbi:MAG: DUF2007 domain-containing protein [Candidatus Hydrogenedentes bacterium]|nr:DUF2007 domain-containing protein [Candidatus Hydrogenedentota bacterium]